MRPSLYWGQVTTGARMGDMAMVDAFLREHTLPRTASVLANYAARGGQLALVQRLVTAHGACPGEAMEGAVDAAPIDAPTGPHIDIVRWLLDPRPGEEPDVYEERLTTALVGAVDRSNHALAVLIVERATAATRRAGLGIAAYTGNFPMARTLFRAGGCTRDDATYALAGTCPRAPTDLLRYLIEKGAADWPEHVYARLCRKPNLVKHLHKIGIPHALLVGGHAPIQAILDEHQRWCAHVRAALDELGVYTVLVDLIVQY